jgi:hypothetical protein
MTQPPSGVKLEVTLLIDQDLWQEIEAEGWSDQDIAKVMKQAVTVNHGIRGALPRVPVNDIMEVNLIKYY